MWVKTQWKYYDAAIGDFTIQDTRMQYVDFTFPFADSGLSIIVPVKLEGSGGAWMFMKPFTLGMWVATAAILVYTMLVVWFLERDQCNPEFSGPWKNQICTALWFTFSSLFFAHREKIYSNLSRLVIVLWLFVVLVLTSSYTANLSSMLTVQQLQPNVIDVEWLKKNNLKVGYDGNLDVRTYMENVLGFKTDNILNVASEYNYSRAFERKHMSAAFIENPYDKVFLNKYCNAYTGTTLNDRFGGLGFIFQKGSPIVRDFSKVIVHLSNNGKLKALEDEWLTPMDECSTNITSNKSQTLSLQSFWVLYLISFATSTTCILLSIICSPINPQNHKHAYEVTASTLVDTAEINADTLEPVESSTPAEIEMLSVSVQTSEPNKASSSETAANLSSKDYGSASPDDHVANLSR